MAVYFSTMFYRKLDRLEPDLKETMLSLMEEWERYREDTVTKVEFGELRDIVRELAAAQQRTEARLEELAAAQQRTEARLEELAAAQQKTEKGLHELVLEHRETRRQLGGLSQSVGYILEDRIIPQIGVYARRQFGIEVSLVDRRNLIYENGEYDELNIYAEGMKEGRPVFLIGECKSQPGKRDLDRFAKLIARVRRHLSGEVQALMVGYQIAPAVEDYARTRHPEIKLANSVQFLVMK
ncbi:MAG: hypothetical protein QM278_07125 [Pseudomonadota bacterium]|nr:hypothetical protein [Pseudomonadota bacterium]